jgi:hypothetical protein
LPKHGRAFQRNGEARNCPSFGYLQTSSTTEINTYINIMKPDLDIIASFIIRATKDSDNSHPADYPTVIEVKGNELKLQLSGPTRILTFKKNEFEGILRAANALNPNLNHGQQD